MIQTEDTDSAARGGIDQQQRECLAVLLLYDNTPCGSASRSATARVIAAGSGGVPEPEIVRVPSCSGTSSRTSKWSPWSQLRRWLSTHKKL
jgi:hypothetical protein